jgi:hypothetical protein
MRQRVLWFRLSLVLIGVVLYAGVVWEPVWSTVDEGREMAYAAQCRQLFVGQHGLPSLKAMVEYSATEGLFRPAFVVLKWAEYECFGFDCWKYHWLRLLVLLGLCQLLFSIALRAVQSPTAAFLAGLLFLSFSPCIENWFRLGEASAFYPITFALPSLWCVVRALESPSDRKTYRWTMMAAAVLLSVPPYFCKESGLALVGLAAGLCLAGWLKTGPLLSLRNTGLSVSYLAANLATAIAWLVLKQHAGTLAIHAGAYSSNYQFAIPSMAVTAFKYTDVLWNGFQFLTPVALLVFGRRVFQWLKRQRPLDAWDGWALVGLCWFGAILALMLPWKQPLGRYLCIGVPGLSLFVGTMLYCLLNETRHGPIRNFSPVQTGLRWLVMGNLVLLPVIGGIRNYNYLLFRHDFDHAASRVIETVATTAPAGARLFMDMPADSKFMFDEMMDWIKLRFGRKDLAQFNYNKQPRPEPQAGDFLLVYVREPATPRSTELWLPESFHAPTLGQLKDRLKLVRCFREERRLPSSYPDAPVFNLVARLGLKLPSYVGMNPEHRRALFMREPSLVEWRVYRFEK